MEIAEVSRSAPRSGRGGRRFKSCHSDHDLAEISRYPAAPWVRRGTDRICRTPSSRFRIGKRPSQAYASAIAVGAGYTTYDDLRAATQVPRILVVLALPRAETTWLFRSGDSS
jgi:hypothetical protein